MTSKFHSFLLSTIVIILINNFGHSIREAILSLQILQGDGMNVLIVPQPDNDILQNSRIPFQLAYNPRYILLLCEPHMLLQRIMFPLGASEHPGLFSYLFPTQYKAEDIVGDVIGGAVDGLVELLVSLV